VNIEDSFWHKAAVDANAKTIYNHSRPCNSIEGINHLILAEQENFDWSGLFLIGIPVLERVEGYTDEDISNYVQIIKNSEVVEERSLASKEGLVTYRHKDLGKKFALSVDRRWTEIRALKELYLLYDWLTYRKQANFMFINLSKSFVLDNQSWSSKRFVKKLSKVPNAILFGDKTYNNINVGVNKPADYDQYGWNGHHGPAGNKYFYENSVKPSLIKSGLL
jgi:hypothetical protein